MIERYSRPEMANIWTEENKYRAWLEVEILADEAWAELGEIPKEDVALIREKADFDIDRILEIEQQTRHDVVTSTNKPTILSARILKTSLISSLTKRRNTSLRS